MTVREHLGWKGLTSALLSSVVLMPQLAYAQDITPESAKKDTASSSSSIEEIVVTANKRAQSINDVGLTITALGDDELERLGVKDLGDLASQVPGLTFASSEFSTPIFTLRGVGYYDKSIGGYPTTSAYVDEIPLPFAVYATHANLDVERVEVLKGPQGTLFGQNSTGGAVNFIAAKPTDTFTAGANATLGRFGRGDVDGFISGPISNTLKARLAVQQDFGSGWQRSYTRDDTLGARDVTNARLLLDWRPTDRLKILLNVNGWRDKSDLQAGQFIAIFPQTSLGTNSAVNPKVAAYPFAPSDPTAADWSPDHRPHADMRQYQPALRGDYNVTDNIVLTSITSYVDYSVNKVMDVDGTSANLYQFRDVASATSFTQELRVAGGEGTPFRWVVGGNYEHSYTHEAAHQTYFDSSINRVLGAGQGKTYANQNLENYAMFANGEYDLLSNLTLKLGGRYTRSRVRAEECTFDAGDGKAGSSTRALYARLHPGAPPPDLPIGSCITILKSGAPGLFVDTLEEHNVSWRAGLDYKPARDVLLYVNVAKGYKAGGYPAVPAVLYTSYLPVVQEGLLDYEGGFKATLLDRKLSVNGAVFFYQYDNKQLLTRRPDELVGTVNALANIPESEVKGAELEVTAVPVEGLHLSGGVTYLDAKITKYVGINAATVLADFAGTPIPFSPKWQYVLNADYDIPTGGKVQPFFGATLTGRTGTTSIVGSAIGAVRRPGFRSLLPIADIYDVPGYALLDFRAGMQAADGEWRAMAWVKNITNKYYVTNVVTAFEGVTRYAGQPRTYGVTVSYRFP